MPNVCWSRYVPFPVQVGQLYSKAWVCAYRAYKGNYEMDLRTQRLMNYLKESFFNADVSGFEVLEILDVRSWLASREPLLDDNDKARLEKIDRQILQSANIWAERISEVADLAEMRKRAHVFPSHWWWYLDEIITSRQELMA